MYIISILAIIAMGKLLTDFSGYSESISWIFNYPILILILLFNFSLLTGTGLLKDFNNAFRLSIWKRKRRESVNELRRAMEAVSLVIKVTLVISIFLFFFESLAILFSLNFDSKEILPDGFGYMIIPGLVGPLYSAAIVLILLPMESMLKLKLWNAQKAQEIEKERELYGALNRQEIQSTLKEQNESNSLDRQETFITKEE